MANPMVASTGGSPQSIYDLSTKKHHEIGTKGVFDDGREFRYCLNSKSTTIDAGALCSATAAIAGHVDENNDTLVIGSKFVTFTTSATDTVANEYAEGFLSGENDPGEGILYKIKSHPILASGVAGVIELYDTVRVASDTGTQLTLTHNSYWNPTPYNAATEAPVGVPLVAVTAGDTTPQYFWVQTKGRCSLLITSTGTAPAVGDECIGTAVAGAVSRAAYTAGDAAVVGVCLSTAANEEHGVVNLNIEA